MTRKRPLTTTTTTRMQVQVLVASPRRERVDRSVLGGAGDVDGGGGVGGVAGAGGVAGGGTPTTFHVVMSTDDDAGEHGGDHDQRGRPHRHHRVRKSLDFSRAHKHSAHASDDDNDDNDDTADDECALGENIDTPRQPHSAHALQRSPWASPPALPDAHLVNEYGHALASPSQTFESHSYLVASPPRPFAHLPTTTPYLTVAPAHRGAAATVVPSPLRQHMLHHARAQRASLSSSSPPFASPFAAVTCSPIVPALLPSHDSLRTHAAAAAPFTPAPAHAPAPIPTTALAVHGAEQHEKGDFTSSTVCDQEKPPHAHSANGKSLALDASTDNSRLESVEFVTSAAAGHESTVLDCDLTAIADASVGDARSCSAANQSYATDQTGDASQAPPRNDDHPKPLLVLVNAPERSTLASISTMARDVLSTPVGDADVTKRVGQLTDVVHALEQKKRRLLLEIGELMAVRDQLRKESTEANASVHVKERDRDDHRDVASGSLTQAPPTAPALAASLRIELCNAIDSSLSLAASVASTATTSADSAAAAVARKTLSDVRAEDDDDDGMITPRGVPHGVLQGPKQLHGHGQPDVLRSPAMGTPLPPRRRPTATASSREWVTGADKATSSSSSSAASAASAESLLHSPMIGLHRTYGTMPPQHTTATATATTTRSTNRLGVERPWAVSRRLQYSPKRGSSDARASPAAGAKVTASPCRIPSSPSSAKTRPTSMTSPLRPSTSAPSLLSPTRPASSSRSHAVAAPPRSPSFIPMPRHETHLTSPVATRSGVNNSPSATRYSPAHSPSRTRQTDPQRSPASPADRSGRAWSSLSVRQLSQLFASDDDRDAADARPPVAATRPHSTPERVARAGRVAQSPSASTTGSRAVLFVRGQKNKHARPASKRLGTSTKTG